jgi:hypothetical protein
MVIEDCADIALEANLILLLSMLNAVAADTEAEANLALWALAV